MTIDQIYPILVDLKRKLQVLSYATDDRLLVSNMLRVIHQLIQQIDDAAAVAIAVSK
jgi:hypothetical protein